MLDARPALTRLGISTSSAMQAVQQVRIYAEDRGESNRIDRTNELLEKVLGVRLGANDIYDQPVGDAYDYAVTIAQAAVEGVIRQQGQVDNVTELMNEARQRASKLITEPRHKWMFAKPEATVVASTEIAVAKTVDVQVAVKANGKIKKGGKEILAIALYEKHVLKAEKPVDNQGFIAILMAELGMSKAGATTYNYNMKKRFNAGAITPKGKK